MQLLEKRQIDGLKARERHQEIQEGKKLAEKVDALRELSAKEQANLAKFTEESRTRLKEEIGALITSREDLKTEIKELERAKVIAKVPLDEEWAKFHAKHAELDALDLEIHAKQEALTKKEEEHRKDVRSLGVEISRVEDERRRSVDSLAKALQFLKEADDTIHGARNAAATVQLTAEFRDNESILREKESQERERIVSQREEDSRKQEKAIEEGWILLRDRQATLEYEINRLKG
jgi:hypothetical protein